jgi:hypothetical protein
MRRLGVILACAAGIAACSSATLSLAEYAETVEGLVAGMEDGFLSIDGAWEAREPSAEGAAEYWGRRLEIRADFLESVRSLDPPDAILSMHRQAVDVFERITEADRALAARVATFSSIDEHWSWVETPEGRAADAVLEEVYAFCRASQDQFDLSEQAQALEDAPWVPAEMQQVVKVAFGCPPE